ncbi:hypothetical protein NP493_81g04040 [Ridgeia piscesae]|uniref:Uncharacterized protein n=1 Tax=Ridgeia piscesae TaxID=27915 RepID=A0AAD9UI64_RIDPI|nr:hypothetical protein NP493_81g04040 [Ridgeia piscesae]
MIPRLYVPEWKQDMKNRKLILRMLILVECPTMSMTMRCSLRSVNSSSTTWRTACVSLPRLCCHTAMRCWFLRFLTIHLVTGALSSCVTRRLTRTIPLTGPTAVSELSQSRRIKAARFRRLFHLSVLSDSCLTSVSV